MKIIYELAKESFKFLRFLQLGLEHHPAYT